MLLCTVPSETIGQPISFTFIFKIPTSWQPPGPNERAALCLSAPVGCDTMSMDLDSPFLLFILPHSMMECCQVGISGKARSLPSRDTPSITSNAETDE